MFTSLFRRKVRNPIVSAEDLETFLTEQTAYVSQRATIEYCKSRSGMNWSKLFKEPDFVAALHACRWDAFAAVLSDLSVIIEGRLRPHAGKESEVVALDLADRAVGILLRSDAPQSSQSEGWAADISHMRGRLAIVTTRPPDDSAEVARVGGARIFRMLPFHEAVRRNDETLVINNVRFMAINFADALDKRLDGAAVVADLTRRRAA